MSLQTLTLRMFSTLVVYRYTKPTRALERLDPFHSMHYEHPGFTTQDVFDYGEGQARVKKDKQVMPIKKREKIRCEGENIDRQNTKWSFEDKLIVKMKIIEHAQAPLHLERGICQIGFETKRVCWHWIHTLTGFVFLDALRFIEGRIVNLTRHDTQAFATIIQFEEAFFSDRKLFSPGNCCIQS